MPIIGSLAGGSAGGYGQRQGKSTKYDIEFLVVAGGGGTGGTPDTNPSGAPQIAGGSGAGGYLTSTQEVDSKTGDVITITVGGGGNQSAGSPSSITAPTLSTVSATGGGRGGLQGSYSGVPGGSGGGNGASVT